MKKFTFTLLSMLSLQLAHAQLTISPNQTATYLANKLVATSGTLGVVVSNATLTCDSMANGEFTGVSNLGIADGIVLSSGSVTPSAFSTTGLAGLPSDVSSASLSQPGDAQLDLILASNTYDACALEFDLQPVGSFVEFEYVFGSDEYPMFNCSSFNDIFAFFISGPGYATPTNIALLPSSTIPVSINSINDGSIVVAGCNPDTTLYVENLDTVCTLNGFTVPLIAHANVTSGSVYHLKMVIGDALDQVLDSYVILKANSLKSGGTSPNGTSQFSQAAGLEVYPTSMNESITLKNSQGQSWKVTITDMNGRNVISQTIEASATFTNIQTSSLAKGIYIIDAISTESNQHLVQKLIKE